MRRLNDTAPKLTEMIQEAVLREAESPNAEKGLKDQGLASQKLNDDFGELSPLDSQKT